MGPILPIICSQTQDNPTQRNTRDSITHMLEMLKWPSFQKHREDARLILLFKLANSLLTIPRNYIPLPSPLSTTRAQHNLKYMHIQPSSGIYQHSFFPRTIPKWNNLHIPDLDTLTLNQFKSMYT